TAGSLDELRKRAAAFKALDSVSDVESVLSLIPTEQETKGEILAEIAPIVDPVVVGPLESVDLDRLRSAVRTLRQRLVRGADHAPPGRACGEVVAARGGAPTLGRRLDDAGIPAASSLSTLQDQLRADFARTLARLRRNLHPTPIGPADVPGELRRKFIGQSGHFLLQIQPRIDIWDRDGAERFIRELRTVDPDVAGTPVITFEAIR